MENIFDKQGSELHCGFDEVVMVCSRELVDCILTANS
jgi:hypothetical protein